MLVQMFIKIKQNPTKMHHFFTNGKYVLLAFYMCYQAMMLLWVLYLHQSLEHQPPPL